MIQLRYHGIIILKFEYGSFTSRCDTFPKRYLITVALVYDVTFAQITSGRKEGIDVRRDGSGGSKGGYFGAPPP